MNYVTPKIPVCMLVAAMVLTSDAARAEGGGRPRERARQEEVKREDNRKREERRVPEMKAAERNAKQSFYEKPNAPSRNAADLQKAIEKDRNNSSGQTLARSQVKSGASVEVASQNVPNAKPKPEGSANAQGRSPAKK